MCVLPFPPSLARHTNKDNGGGITSGARLRAADGDAAVHVEGVAVSKERVFRGWMYGSGGDVYGVTIKPIYLAQVIGNHEPHGH